MKKPLCQAIGLVLVSLVFSVAVYSQPTTTQAAARVSLLSRLEFSPELFESIRAGLSQKLSRPCSLYYHSVDDIASLSFNESVTHVLVESGINEACLPAGLHKSEICIDLVWLLAASSESMAYMRDDFLNARQFVEILAALKKQNPNKFPWFEPLCSRITMRNFCLILAGSGGLTKASLIRPLWQENRAIAFLYRAIESEYLNPLSVEADVSLAASVFTAGDSEFTTCWVPLEQFLQQSASVGRADKVVLMPFPAAGDRALIPRIRLTLWYRQGQGAVLAPTGAGPFPVASYTLVDLNFAEDMEWIGRNFSDQYDALIMGDY